MMKNNCLSTSQYEVPLKWIIFVKSPYIAYVDPKSLSYFRYFFDYFFQIFSNSSFSYWVRQMAVTIASGASSRVAVEEAAGVVPSSATSFFPVVSTRTFIDSLLDVLISTSTVSPVGVAKATCFSSAFSSSYSSTGVGFVSFSSWTSWADSTRTLPRGMNLLENK